MNLRESQEIFWKAARREATPEQIARCFVADEKLSAEGRMAVYAGAYFARQESVLAELLPKTRALLGAAFPGLARNYALARPGHHPAVEQFTNDFGTFLEQVPGFEQPAALAKIEVARNMALRAPHDLTQTVTLGQLQKLAPNSNLHVSRSAQLICTGAAAFDSFRAGDRPVREKPDEPVWLLFFRKRLSVQHRSIAQDEALAISRLKDGTTLKDLCEVFLDHEQPAQRAHAVLSALLRDQLLLSSSAGDTPP